MDGHKVIKKAQRKYTKQARKDGEPSIGGPSRGGGSTRGKKKRVANDMESRTIVASNPFDDDNNNSSSSSQPSAAISHMHQVHYSHSHLGHNPQQHLHPHHMHRQPPPHLHSSPGPIGICPSTNHQMHQQPYGLGTPTQMHPHQPGLPQPPTGSPYQQQPHQAQPRMPHMQHQPGPLPQPMDQPTPPPVRPIGTQVYGYGLDPSPPPTGQQSQHQQPPPPQSSPLIHAPQHPPMDQQQQMTQYPTLNQQQQPPQQQPQPMVYCGECRGSIYQNEPRIMCRAGCDAYYHRECSGLTQLACELLLAEPAAEWACNRCICGDRRIPVVRIHGQQNDGRQPVWLQQ